MKKLRGTFRDGSQSQLFFFAQRHRRISHGLTSHRPVFPCTVFQFFLSFSMRNIQTSQPITAAFNMRCRQAGSTSSSPLHPLGFAKQRLLLPMCPQDIAGWGGRCWGWCEVPVAPQRMFASVHSHKGNLGLSTWAALWQLL